MEGTQSQLRFLPEKHTDFAFAVFGEEWGFVGAMVLLILFCSFLYQVYIVAMEAKDDFGNYLAAGCSFIFLANSDQHGNGTGHYAGCGHPPSVH